MIDRRVFITGALGFIGRALGDRWRADGWEISGVDVRADAARLVVAGDITQPGGWQERMVGAELVIHTAAVVSNAVDFERTWAVNVLGTRRVVEAAAATGVRRLVHFSSVRAFSDRGYPDAVAEMWPVRTDGNAYVDTKIASEHVVLAAHAAGEIVATIVRPGDVYGPGSRPWVLLPLEAIKQGRFALPANGQGAFTPVYIDNLVDGVALAARCPQAEGQIFTLTDGITVTSEKFFAHLFRMLDQKGPRTLPTPIAVASAAAYGLLARARGVKTEITPTAVRYLARRGGYSIEKAQRLLDYRPMIDLSEGMRRTEAWLRAEGLLDDPRADGRLDS